MLRDSVGGSCLRHSTSGSCGLCVAGRLFQPIPGASAQGPDGVAGTVVRLWRMDTRVYPHGQRGSSTASSRAQRRSGSARLVKSAAAATADRIDQARADVTA